MCSHILVTPTNFTLHENSTRGSSHYMQTNRQTHTDTSNIIGVVVHLLVADEPRIINIAPPTLKFLNQWQTEPEEKKYA